MSGFLFKPTLTLTMDSAGNARVAPVEVRLSELQKFEVDPFINPVAEDSSVLPPLPAIAPTGTHNPFIITDCAVRYYYSSAMLTFRDEAIGAWQSVFENATAVIVLVRLRNGLVRNLTVDMWS